MRSDPQIFVECDGKNCKDTVEVGMTPLARGSFDDRNVAGELRNRGWWTDGTTDLCPECKKEHEA